MIEVATSAGADAGTVAGAVYVAVVIVELVMVPQLDVHLLVPVIKVQVTPAFAESPVTVAVKDFVPVPAATVAEVGEMVTESGGSIVRVAEP